MQGADTDFKTVQDIKQAFAWFDLAIVGVTD